MNSTAGSEIHEVPSGAATTERMQRWENWLVLRQETALDPELEFSTRTTTCGIAVTEAAN